MRKYFLANINIDGKGGVVASPDHNTPGGSYYFHWMRDGALSMDALRTTTPAFADVSDTFAAYAGWVKRAQAASDPHGQTQLTEPKFNLPDGGVFTGAWCRPQNDGPGLRAKTLMGYAAAAPAQAAALWPLIRTDLDWAAGNSASATCDLWEEVRSEDFFWNRYSGRRAVGGGH
jgi:glucoamylase